MENGIAYYFVCIIYLRNTYCKFVFYEENRYEQLKVNKTVQNT